MLNKLVVRVGKTKGYGIRLDERAAECAGTLSPHVDLPRCTTAACQAATGFTDWLTPEQHQRVYRGGDEQGGEENEETERRHAGLSEKSGPPGYML